MENEKSKSKRNILETKKLEIDDLSAFKCCIVYFTAIVLGFFFGFSRRDRNNQFIRFNAFQALFLWAVFLAVGIIFLMFILIFVAVHVFALVVIFDVLLALCFLFLFTVLVFTAYKTYEGEQYIIPVIGKWAQSIAYGKADKAGNNAAETGAAAGESAATADGAANALQENETAPERKPRAKTKATPKKISGNPPENG